MKCPECGYEHSRVTDTHRKIDGLRRYRSCRKCGARFATMERVEVWDPVAASYAAVPEQDAAVVQLMPLPKETAQTAQPAAARAMPRYVAALNTESLAGLSLEVQKLLVEWWNVSRRSKHKGNATWTEGAWLASVKRVRALTSQQQVLLAQAGVEHGWQALKPEFIRDELWKPTATGRPMPKDPAMLAALESWGTSAA